MHRGGLLGLEGLALNVPTMQIYHFWRLKMLF
jgi:hypothetical protein